MNIRIIILAMLLGLGVVSCSKKTSVSSRTSTSKTSSVDKKRADVKSYALSLEGSRYKYGGETSKGFDCSGFTMHVLQKANVSLPHQSGLQSKEGSSVKLEHAQAGDLLFFKKSGKINHVALILSSTKDGVTVVHSTSSKGVIVQNVSKSSYWKSKIAFARRVIQ